MKIGFDAKRALNNATGLGNYSRGLANALIKYYPGNEYLLYTPKAKDEFFHQLHGDFQLRLPEGGQKLFPSFWRSYDITRELQKERLDVYHGLSNELPFNIHRSGIRTVVTIHDLIFLKHTEQYPVFDRWVYNLKTKYAARNAHKIIAVSKETKNDLVDYYKVPEDKIEVIYQSIDERFWNAELGVQNAELKSKYQLPAKYILNVGSFFPRKNHKILIEAFDRVKEKIWEHLVLVGSNGGMKNEIEQFVHQKNLQDRVKIITNVSNADMPAIYRAASLFVFPSLYEGFGIPVLEALASKVPVITTKGGSMEEAGGAGSVYIKPTDAEEIAAAIVKVLGSETQRKKMIDAGYQHSLSMGNKATAEKTMALYKRL